MSKYATIVLCAPDDVALEAAVKPLFETIGFSSDKAKPRICAASWSQDAMSILDAVLAVNGCDALDPYERTDCIAEIIQCRTWEDCLAKFAEWDLDLRDGELVDAHEAEAA